VILDRDGAGDRFGASARDTGASSARSSSRGLAAPLTSAPARAGQRGLVPLLKHERGGVAATRGGPTVAVPAMGSLLVSHPVACLTCVTTPYSPTSHFLVTRAPAPGMALSLPCSAGVARVSTPACTPEVPGRSPGPPRRHAEKLGVVGVRPGRAAGDPTPNSPVDGPRTVPLRRRRASRRYDPGVPAFKNESEPDPDVRSPPYAPRVTDRERGTAVVGPSTGHRPATSPTGVPARPPNVCGSARYGGGLFGSRSRNALAGLARPYGGCAT